MISTVLCKYLCSFNAYIHHSRSRFALFDVPSVVIIGSKTHNADSWRMHGAAEQCPGCLHTTLLLLWLELTTALAAAASEMMSGIDKDISAKSKHVIGILACTPPRLRVRIEHL